MATHGIKSGQTITGTANEEGYTLIGSHETPITVVTVTLLTGSYQYAIGPLGGVPVIDNTYTTLSTADDKKLVTLNPGTEELRIKGICTIHISY